MNVNSVILKTLLIKPFRIRRRQKEMADKYMSSGSGILEDYSLERRSDHIYLKIITETHITRNQVVENGRFSYTEGYTSSLMVLG
jgi:hypothetical protein